MRGRFLHHPSSRRNYSQVQKRLFWLLNSSSPIQFALRTSSLLIWPTPFLSSLNYSSPVWSSTEMKTWTPPEFQHQPLWPYVSSNFLSLFPYLKRGDQTRSWKGKMFSLTCQLWPGGACWKANVENCSEGHVGDQQGRAVWLISSVCQWHGNGYCVTYTASVCYPWTFWSQLSFQIWRSMTLHIIPPCATILTARLHWIM